MKRRFFDAVVVGVGSMGSATCYHLAAQGYTALGLEQFEIVHERGSHAGQSRIIRKAYFEHPDYVPLLERAYQNWRTIEAETGAKLFFSSGVLYMGNKTDAVMKGVVQSAQQYNIPVENLDNSALQKRFPQFRLPSSFQGIMEPDAGFVLPELSIQTFTNAALEKGAVINTGEVVIDWEKRESVIVVKTNRQTYETDRLIFTAGAWTSRLLFDLKSKLTVTRQLLAWVQTSGKNLFSLDEMPCWFISDKEGGSFYGFPDLANENIQGPTGIKVARHYPGRPVSPDDIISNDNDEEIARVLSFLQEFMPAAGTEISAIKNCLYTNSPDEDFIIDFVPGTDRKVIVAGGFSGHGFKFVPVVGEILADMAIKGKSPMPISFLNLSRF